MRVSYFYVYLMYFSVEAYFFGYLSHFSSSTASSFLEETIAITSYLNAATASSLLTDLSSFINPTTGLSLLINPSSF
jgi:hypothetical protein